jgi:dGTPase
VARGILEKEPTLQSTNLPEIGAIVSAGCLAHDLGNPPFGHFGERAFSTFFSEGKGLPLKNHLTEEQWNDLTHFEGNANTFRLLTHQFEGRRKGGFVLTYSTLASIVKYPYSSTHANKKGKFGFFTSERESYERIAEKLGVKKKGDQMYARHPLVYLVEAADDICYEIMDIEDSFKLKILSLQETKDLLLGYFPEDRRAKMEKTLNMVSDHNEQIAYLRSNVIGLLTNECTQAFLDNEEQILDGTFEGSLISHIPELPASAYKHCCKVATERIYKSRDVVDIEVAGFRIIGTLIELMTEAVLSPDKAYSQLLINRVSSQYNMKSPALFDRIQAVLDYVSGMTDVFALDLYRKLNGNSLPAV